MSESIDISVPLRTLCNLFGVEYESVRWIEFTPGEVKLEQYVRNEHGRFYVKDGERDPKVARYVFKVTT